MGYETKYVNTFKKLTDSEEAQKLFRLNGNRLLIEVLPPRELKTASGIIIAAPSGYDARATAEAFKPTLGVVLLTGPGYIDADGTPIDMDVKVGMVVMVADLGMRYLSQFPGLSDYTKNTIALITEGDVQMQFPSLEAYEAYEDLLGNAK